MTVIVNPEPAERLRIGASTGLIRMRGEDTGGELSILEFHLPAQTLGATPHIHDGHAEDFVIMSGEVTFDLLVDGKVASQTVGAGGTVTVPAGAVHGFRNDATVDAVIVGLFRPSELGHPFVRRRSRSAADAGPEDMARLRARFRSRTL